MINIILYLSIGLAFLFLISASGYPLLSRLPWVRKKLIKPYKEFSNTSNNNSEILNSRYQLSKETRAILDYYNEKFDRPSLQDLALEIQLKIRLQKDSSHLMNFLTVGLLPLFSLLIACFALFTDIPSSQLIFVFRITIIVLIAIVVVILFDLASKMYVEEPLKKHLLVIHRALDLKNDPTAKSPTTNKETENNTPKENKKKKKKNNKNKS